MQTKTRLLIYLDGDVKRDLRLLAAEYGCSISSLLRPVIREHVDRRRSGSRVLKADAAVVA